MTAGSVKTCLLCHTSTLVVMSHESNAFSRSASFELS